MKYIEDYIVERSGPNGSYVEKVLCKCCGETITILTEGEKPLRIEKIHGRTIVYMPMIMAQTPMYYMLEFEMTDGKHATPICKSCKDCDLDFDELYRIDIKRLFKVGVDKEYGKYLNNRRPAQSKRFKKKEK